MKFNTLVAMIAIISMAGQANAQSDGTLRRVIAENESVNAETAGESQTKQGVIILNTTTVTPAPVQQPATVVEAAPASESKAEQLRKARVGAEVSTEQKIVEKLEESRLKEEQERADRLFGNKFEAPAAAAAAQPQPTVVVPAEKAQPTQVTIEKVEIVQPAQSQLPPPEIQSIKEVKEESSQAEGKSSLSLIEEEKAPVKERQIYVSGSLGGVNYDASNVKGNFGGGFAIGMLMEERVAVEANFLYSNHFIDTFWNPGIYRELDQYDVGINAKYFLLTTRLQPYIGAGASYITRQYKQRVVTTNVINGTTTVANGPQEDQTEAINLNLMVGADFKATENLRIGGGLDYSTNIMNRNEFEFANYYSQLPENTKALEEIDFWTLKVNATLTF